MPSLRRPSESVATGASERGSGTDVQELLVSDRDRRDRRGAAHPRRAGRPEASVCLREIFPELRARFRGGEHHRPLAPDRCARGAAGLRRIPADEGRLSLRRALRRSCAALQRADRGPPCRAGRRRRNRVGLHSRRRRLRCAVSYGRDELWIAGRCFSATHDAHASCRSMAQTMAMGQAAGMAAALSLVGNCGAREVPVASLQARLRASGAVLEMPATIAATGPNDCRRNSS